MISAFKNLKAREIAERIHTGKITSVEVTKHFLERTEEINPDINALISCNSEFALIQAEQIDKRIKNNEIPSPLAGVPIVIKDNINVKGLPATCASKHLANHISVFNATATEKLEAAGLVIIGKSNMDEFAMGSSNEQSHFGAVKNPVDAVKVAGGSSGGSAAAVASGMTPMALGSDTGGSVKLPASFCGLVGLRPSYGRVSRYGLVSFASSLDQIGVITFDIKDAAYLFSIIAGHDHRDSTSVDIPADDYIRDMDKDPGTLKIGIPKEYFADGIHPEVRKVISDSIEKLKKRKFQFIDISLATTKYCIAVYYILANAEASANLARYDGVRYGWRYVEGGSLDEMYVQTRTEGFGPEVKRRIMLGTFALSKGFYDRYYRKAQRARELISDDLKRAFDKCDLILTPTSPTTAFNSGEKLADPLQMYLSDIYLAAPSLAGIPSLTLPCGKDRSGLPVGLQLMSPYFDEANLLRGAYQIERILSDA